MRDGDAVPHPSVAKPGFMTLKKLAHFTISGLR